MSQKKFSIGPWTLFLFVILPFVFKTTNMSASPDATDSTGDDTSPRGERSMLLHSDGDAMHVRVHGRRGPDSHRGDSDSGSDFDDSSAYSGFFYSPPPTSSPSMPRMSHVTSVHPMFSGEIDVAVAGIIGAGKSTLSRSLGCITESRVFEEPSDTNPFLARFYANQSQWSFHTQVSFIAQRFKNLQNATQHKKRIYDRCAFEDCIFARMLHADAKMEDDEYATYKEMFSTLAHATETKIPKMVLFLDVTPETALHRIRERARGMEVSIDLDYLMKLDAEYRRWLDEISKRTHVVVVNWERFMDPAELWRKVRYFKHAGQAGVVGLGHD